MTTLLVLLAALGCGSTSSSGDAATDTGGGDAAADTGGGGNDSAAGLPGFGQACAPIAQQGDPQCATGLVCVSVGAEQGRNLCTQPCTTAGATCTGGPSGSMPTCGREYQVASGIGRVCEFFCGTGATSCPPGTNCLVDYAGMMTCQPPLQ